MDMMIDLETMGTQHNTVVLSIGAVFFDLEKGILGPEFYAILDRDNQLEKGCTFTKETMQWWSKQAPEAKAIFQKEGADPVTVLSTFTKFYKQHPKTAVWGNGSSFDISIMQELYQTYGSTAPWDFWNVMDLRTFRRFVGKNALVEKLGTNHNALDDAKSQAKYVIEHYQKAKVS